MATNKISIDDLSIKELKQLQNDVAVALHNFEKRKKNEAKSALEATAREYGFKIEELIGGVNATKSKAKVAPKYAHPENPELTWTGRGRKPKWVEAALATGKALSDLAI
jgi:DNA-binding protein H-NS